MSTLDGYAVAPLILSGDSHSVLLMKNGMTIACNHLSSGGDF
jgi:hypothetical protein